MLNFFMQAVLVYCYSLLLKSARTHFCMPGAAQLVLCWSDWPFDQHRKTL